LHNKNDLEVIFYIKILLSRVNRFKKKSKF